MLYYYCCMSLIQESLLSDIIDQKPISQLNSSDVDQVAGVVAGSSKRSNYTNETLTQLNRIVEYFSLNESAVAGLIDKQDANVSMSFIIDIKLFSLIDFSISYKYSC